MSYRFYIGKINNTEYDKLSSAKNKAELAKIVGVEYSEEEDYIWLGDVVRKYEIDQISDMVCELNIDEATSQFFKDKAINASFNYEMDLVLLSKEDLMKLINKYEQSTFEFFQRKHKEIQECVLNQDFKEMENQILSHFAYKISEWQNGGVVNKKDDKPYRIVDSWQIEYGVFDLIHLYKTTDFENEKIFYFAH